MVDDSPPRLPRPYFPILVATVLQLAILEIGPDRWIQQFEKKSGSDPLRLGRDVHGILGSTLSAREESRKWG